MSVFRKNIVPLIVITAVVAAVLTYFYRPEYFDFIIQPSARSIYERSLEKTPGQLDQWKKLTTLAKQDSVNINESFSENIITSTRSPFSAGYMVDIAQGESLLATVKTDTINSSWILEAYSLNGDLLQTAVATDSLMTILIRERESSTIRLVVQSFLELTDTTLLKIYKQPILEFPLAGKGNDAIQSFWGVARDGGRRSHEGNDIFADRGHPVVAAADGRISSVRDRGLGGKQIWLRDELTASSHYYAHLDSQLVTSGQRVSRGDTIGLVGNTGNARTTPPHLHFGLYRTGGAVDPKPYIWKIPIPADSEILPIDSRVIGSGSGANLRNQPDANGGLLRSIQNDRLTILGNAKDWYHLRTADSLAGFAHKSVIKLIE
ncbi:Murein DD-endopeptidase MepM and murein hydrolase activator NlpD, contain LysM domain [Nonlabens sp. Hel1_33_55]|uniref:peptidoglycan DD-metalloendopeptidase family protein n=1 Tax=Nonlabens sp. Hel1_33_55 TaxID=1336802 RepID=UPI000875B6D4|nr:M23 family metallopeptidase [Nonlabens sp. Hel1_33_55]SCY35430.1 Murein DD-endopeptidase MepM and murein hydrolase activator NlpD, contain LysM domain [Nonlabens sp. Hel1_33_55]